MNAKFVYMTASTFAEAETIGRALVDERLAACINIPGNMTSIYRWEGEITQETEVSFIAKTTEELFDRVVARVQELHSYDCPCIVSIPIDGGASDYLNWIDSETR